MTSFSSPQDQPYKKDIQQYTVHHTTHTYHNVVPIETAPTYTQTSTQSLEKRFSFADKVEPNDVLLQKAQNIHTTNLAPNYLEPSDINNRLDQLLKNAENALTRSRRREGSISTYQPMTTSGVLTDFDAGLSLNSAEVQRRAGANITPGATTINEIYTYPAAQPYDVEQTLSLNSAEIYKKTPATFTPNATSHRYSPTPKSRPHLDVHEYNHVSAFGSAEANKKTAGLYDSTPNSTSLKYSPIQQYPSQGYESGFMSSQTTKRSEVGQPAYNEEPLRIVSYDVSKTLPRSYNNLFPIREVTKFSSKGILIIYFLD